MILRHISSYVQSQRREEFDFFHPSVVATEETTQLWCLGIMRNGDGRLDVAHKNDKGIRK